MALWTLAPDKLDGATESAAPRFGAFLTTTISFFIVAALGLCTLYAQLASTGSKPG